MCGQQEELITSDECGLTSSSKTNELSQSCEPQRSNTVLIKLCASLLLLCTLPGVWSVQWPPATTCLWRDGMHYVSVWRGVRHCVIVWRDSRHCISTWKDGRYSVSVGREGRHCVYFFSWHAHDMADDKPLWQAGKRDDSKLQTSGNTHRWNRELCSYNHALWRRESVRWCVQLQVQKDVTGRYCSWQASADGFCRPYFVVLVILPLKNSVECRSTKTGHPKCANPGWEALRASCFVDSCQGIHGLPPCRNPRILWKFWAQDMPIWPGWRTSVPVKIKTAMRLP